MLWRYKLLKPRKAKVDNKTLALVKIKTENGVLQDIKTKVLNENYLNNALYEQEGKNTSLTMIIPDGDKFSADFIKKKLQEYLKTYENIYPNCVIMYSYGVYPKDAVDDFELMKKTQDTLQKIRE